MPAWMVERPRLRKQADGDGGGMSGLPWQRHPCEGRASKLERDREEETERNSDGLLAERQIELL